MESHGAIAGLVRTTWWRLAATTLVALSGAVVPACQTAPPDGRDRERVLEGTIEESQELRESVTLTIRTPDGQTLAVNVARGEFEKVGFVAAGRSVCPPPHEQISAKCVKCNNGNVACHD